MSAADVRGSVAMVGIGATRQGRHPGRSSTDLAVEAVKLALDEARLRKSDIDGLITCRTGFTGEGGDVDMGRLLGLNPAYSAALSYGTCNFSIHLAAAVINAGLAETILLTYGTNQGTAFDRLSAVPHARTSEGAPYGDLDPVVSVAALMARRFQHDYGTTSEQFGAVAVAQRHWAEMNPIAKRNGPTTIDEYLADPFTIEPVRSFDMTTLDDGGVALILTSAKLAGRSPNRPVYVLGMGQSTSLRRNATRHGLTRWWARSAAERTFANAGMTPANVDVLMIQEPGTIWVLQMLEHFGFCAPGEAGSFVADGHTSPGGTLPVNTSGGHLSEGYMWGWLHTAEAIRQLRGTCGARQVPNASVAMHCATMSDRKASGTIYGLEP